MKKILNSLFPNTYQQITTEAFVQGKSVGRSKLRREILEELEAFGVEKLGNDEVTLGFKQAVGIVKKV